MILLNGKSGQFLGELQASAPAATRHHLREVVSCVEAIPATGAVGFGELLYGERDRKSPAESSSPGFVAVPASPGEYQEL
jgi:hypothetical protein